MLKKIAPDKAKTVARAPTSDAGQILHCLSRSKEKEYLIVPGKGRTFTLWRKETKGWLEIATADSPREMDDVIEWDA